MPEDSSYLIDVIGTFGSRRGDTCSRGSSDLFWMPCTSLYTLSAPHDHAMPEDCSFLVTVIDTFGAGYDVLSGIAGHGDRCSRGSKDFIWMPCPFLYTRFAPHDLDAGDACLGAFVVTQEVMQKLAFFVLSVHLERLGHIKSFEVPICLTTSTLQLHAFPVPAAAQLSPRSCSLSYQPWIRVATPLLKPLP